MSVRVAWLAVVPLVVACDNPNVPRAPRLAISRDTLTLYVNDTLALRAEVTGLQSPDPVEWRSLDPTVAIVNDTGLLVARRRGDARIVASSGALADTARVTVKEDLVAPTLSGFVLSDSGVIDVSTGAKQLTMSIRAQDVESGTRRVRFWVIPTGMLWSTYFACVTTAPQSGSREDGTWSCTVPLNEYLPTTRWTVQAQAFDAATAAWGPVREFRIGSGLLDVEPPRLTAIDMPDTVVANTTFTVRATVRDSGAGPAAVHVTFEPPGGSSSFSTSVENQTLLPAHGEVTLSISTYLSTSLDVQEWRLREVTVRDVWGPQRVYLNADLVAMGLKSRVIVVRRL